MTKKIWLDITMMGNFQIGTGVTPDSLYPKTNRVFFVPRIPALPGAPWSPGGPISQDEELQFSHLFDDPVVCGPPLITLARTGRRFVRTSNFLWGKEKTHARWEGQEIVDVATCLHLSSCFFALISCHFLAMVWSESGWMNHPTFFLALGIHH